METIIGREEERIALDQHTKFGFFTSFWTPVEYLII